MATIKEINHDSGGTMATHYSSVTDPDGGLAISGAAGLNGSSNGVRADYDAGTNLMFVTTAIAGFSTNDFRWRFRLKFDNLSNSSGNSSISVYSLEENSSGIDVFEFVFRWNGTSIIEIGLLYRSDGGGTTSIYAFGDLSDIPTSGEVCIELAAIRETSDGNGDGTAEVFIDGVSQGVPASTLDNFNSFATIDQVFCSWASNIGNVSGSYDYDEWILDDDSAADLGCGAPSTAFRFLGFAADTGMLMVSGLKDAATLKLYDYDLATLTEAGTASFGSATDTDLDNRTLGIFPVSRPMADDVWYLFGNDGNDLQVQYNDRNGTLGWTDLGPGTAIWDTAKYAVALMPEPTRPDDVIVAFSDNDVYRTRFGTLTWVKMGDAGGTLRAAARQITNRFNEALFAGTAAGTLEYTNNFGVTFGDVSGTALGVINALAVSL